MSKWCFGCCRSTRNVHSDLRSLENDKDFDCREFDFYILHLIGLKREIRLFTEFEIEDLREKFNKLTQSQNNDLITHLFPHLSGRDITFKSASEFTLYRRKLKKERNVPFRGIGCSQQRNYICDTCYYGVAYLEFLYNQSDDEDIIIPKLSLKKDKLNYRFEYERSHPNATREFRGKLPSFIPENDEKLKRRAKDQFKIIMDCFFDFLQFLFSRFINHGLRVSVESLPSGTVKRIGDFVEEEKRASDEKRNISIKLRRVLKTRLYEMVFKIMRNSSFPIDSKTKVGKNCRKLNHFFARNHVRYNYVPRYIEGTNRCKKHFLLQFNRCNILKGICLNEERLLEMMKVCIVQVDYVSKRRSVFYKKIQESTEYNEPDILGWYDFEIVEFDVEGGSLGGIGSISLTLGDNMDETVLTSDPGGEYLAQVGRMTTKMHPKPQEDDSTLLSFMLSYDTRDNSLTPKEFRELLGKERYGEELKKLEKILFPVFIESTMASELFTEYEGANGILIYVSFCFKLKNDEIGYKENHLSCESKKKKGLIQTSILIDERKNERFKILCGDDYDPEDPNYDNFDFSKITHLSHLIHFRDWIFFGEKKNKRSVSDIKKSDDEVVESGLNDDEFPNFVMLTQNQGTEVPMEGTEYIPMEGDDSEESDIDDDQPIILKTEFNSLLGAKKNYEEPKPIYSQGSLYETIYRGLGTSRVGFDGLVHLPKSFGRSMMRFMYKVIEDGVRKCLKKRVLKNEFSHSFSGVLVSWRIIQSKLCFEKIDGNNNKNNNKNNNVYSRKLFHNNKAKMINVDGSKAKILLGMTENEKKIEEGFVFCSDEVCEVIKNFREKYSGHFENVDSEGFLFFEDLSGEIGSFLEVLVEALSILRKFPYVTDNEAFVLLPRLLVKILCFWFVWGDKIGVSRYLSYLCYVICMYLQVIFDGEVYSDGMENTERKNSGQSGSKEFFQCTTKFRRTKKGRKVRFKHVHNELNRKTIPNEKNNWTDTTFGMMLQEISQSKIQSPLYLYPDKVFEIECLDISDLVQSENPVIREYGEKIKNISKVDPIDEEYLKFWKDKLSKIQECEEEEIIEFFQKWMDLGRRHNICMKRFEKNQRILKWSDRIDEDIKSLLNKNQLPFFELVRKAELSGDMEEEDFSQILSFALFGETSMGKTRVMSLILLFFLNQMKTNIGMVIGPSIVLDGWVETIKFLCDELDVKLPKFVAVQDLNLSTKKAKKEVKKALKGHSIFLWNPEFVITLQKHHDKKIYGKDGDDIYTLLYKIQINESGENVLQVLDEGHDVVRGKKGDVLEKSKCERKYVLTATPITDYGMSYYSIYRFLFSHITDHSIKEMLKKLYSKVEEMTELGKLKLFGEVLKCSEDVLNITSHVEDQIYIRLEPTEVTYKGVLLRQHEYIVMCHLSNEQKKKIKKIEEGKTSRMLLIQKIEPILFSSMEKNEIDINLDTITLRELGSSKINIVIEKIIKSKIRKKKIVIFCRTVLAIKLLYNLIIRYVIEEVNEEITTPEEEEEEETEGEETEGEEEKKVDPDIHESHLVFKIHGSKSQKNVKKRKRIMKMMKRLPGFRCLIISSIIGGKGLNMPWAWGSISFESFWRFDEDHQERSRNYRHGQKENCWRVKYMQSLVECDMFRASEAKRDVMDSIVRKKKINDPSSMYNSDISYQKLIKFFEANSVINELSNHPDNLKDDCEKFISLVMSGTTGVQNVFSVVRREDLESFVRMGDIYLGRGGLIRGGPQKDEVHEASELRFLTSRKKRKIQKDEKSEKEKFHCSEKDLEEEERMIRIQEEEENGSNMKNGEKFETVVFN